MTHIEALDTILAEIDKIDSKTMSESTIRSVLEQEYKVLKGSAVMLEQLVMDGYLWIDNEILEPVSEEGGEIVLKHYVLTSKGKMFIDQGGYSFLDLLRDEKRTLEKKMYKITAILVWSTVIAAFYYIFEILDNQKQKI